MEAICNDNFLIVHPRTISRYNAIISLLKPYSVYRLLIITEKNKYQGFHNLTIDDLSKINIATLINNPEIDCIVFESTSLFHSYIKNITLDECKPKILIFTSWGENYDLHGVQRLSIGYISDNIPLSWNLINIKLSDDQLLYYDRMHTILSNRDKNILSKITLALLDDISMRKIISNDEIVSPTSYIIDKSPKLSTIVDNLIIHSASNASQQIVYSNYESNISIIKNLIMNSIPDIGNSVLFVSNLDNYNNPASDIEYILHILDTYENAKILLEKIYIHPISTSLKIFLYIATHPDIESNEVSISNKFMTNITNEDSHYSSLLQSPKIIFEQSEYVIS